LYWAQALAAQSQDAGLKAKFAPIAQALTSNEAKIVAELNSAQGGSVDVGGYYHPSPAQCSTSMRPSATLNAVVDPLR
jgi:isocitrate dehydrogenase